MDMEEFAESLHANPSAETRSAICALAFDAPLIHDDVRRLLSLKPTPPFVEQWSKTMDGRVWAVRLAWRDIIEAIRARLPRRTRHRRKGHRIRIRKSTGRGP